MTENATVPRQTVEALAENIRSLMGNYNQQRLTQIKFLRACAQQLRSPDSRKRQGAIAAMLNLADMMEKQG
jgi:hypothetical protein